MGWMILAVEILKMDDFLAKIVAGVVVVVMNYFFSRIFVFKKEIG
jgi:putative flippase GtrA